MAELPVNVNQVNGKCREYQTQKRNNCNENREEDESKSHFGNKMYQAKSGVYL